VGAFRHYIKPALQAAIVMSGCLSTCCGDAACALAVASGSVALPGRAGEACAAAAALHAAVSTISRQNGGNLAGAFRWLAASACFARFERSDRIQRAMLSCGYDGEVAQCLPASPRLPVDPVLGLLVVSLLLLAAFYFSFPDGFCIITLVEDSGSYPDATQRQAAFHQIEPCEKVAWWDQQQESPPHSASQRHPARQSPADQSGG
jgi:hypothetical protein